MHLNSLSPEASKVRIGRIITETGSGGDFRLDTDWMTRGCVIVGKSGTGKSHDIDLLAGQVSQLGHAVVILDRTGEHAEALFQTLLRPYHEARSGLFVSPSRSFRPYHRLDRRRYRGHPGYPFALLRGLVRARADAASAEGNQGEPADPLSQRLGHEPRNLGGRLYVPSEA